MFAKLKALSAVILACVFAWGGPVAAWPAHGGGGGGGGGYTGPGDIVSGAVSWWGLRAYTAALAAAGTTKAIKVHNASTSENCDVLIATTGGLGNTTACSGSSSGIDVATFCGANCTITNVYDQVSGYTMLSLGTDATLAFNCINTTLPCIVFAGAQAYESFGNPSDTSQPLSISAVAIRTGGTGQQDILSAARGVFFAGSYGSGSASGYFGASPTTAAETDGAWHAMQWVVNGNTSTVNVDGTPTTGLDFGTGTLPTTGIYMGKQVGGSFLTGKIVEGGIWPTVTFTSPQQTNLCHNEYSYWATVTSC